MNELFVAGFSLSVSIILVFFLIRGRAHYLAFGIALMIVGSFWQLVHFGIIGKLIFQTQAGSITGLEFAAAIIAFIITAAHVYVAVLQKLNWQGVFYFFGSCGVVSGLIWTPFIISVFIFQAIFT